MYDRPPVVCRATGRVVVLAGPLHTASPLGGYQNTQLMTLTLWLVACNEECWMTRTWHGEPLRHWCRGLVWQPRHAATAVWKWCSASRPDHRRGRRADLRHPAWDTNVLTPGDSLTLSIYRRAWLWRGRWTTSLTTVAATTLHDDDALRPSAVPRGLTGWTSRPHLRVWQRRRRW